MYASNFYFDGHYASEFDLIICSFDSEMSEATGGEIEFNIVKSPSNDRYDFYGSNFNSVLEWKFSIMKNICNLTQDQYVFTESEERQIRKWLTKINGYRWISFLQEGYDVYYNVYINVTSHQVDGMTIGFDLIVTSDCGYGFSNIIQKDIEISADKPCILNICNDLGTYIYPKITINGSGDFYLSNNKDLEQNIENEKESRFYNISSEVVVDSENDIVQGLTNPDDFNWHNLRFVDGLNEITTNSSSTLSLHFEYREPRRVIL